jgi:sterol desaturase/sphingolipid hydroxylase (fatty acid hydroxylase superfamily)
MGSMFISNKDETVRLFKNPVLEYFSHIHPATPLVVFLPVVVWTLYGSMVGSAWMQSIGVWTSVGAFAVGTLAWTLVEYMIHRWAFHIEPTTDLGKRVHFLVHGIHHDYPRDSTRLVMPLLVSIPLAMAFYALFAAMLGPFHNALFGGFIFGYVAYDSIHYATHHFPMTSRIGRFLKEYHMKHHYVDDHTGFGVSTPLWDIVFRTVPAWARKRSSTNSSAPTS